MGRRLQAQQDASTDTILGCGAILGTILVVALILGGLYKGYTFMEDYRHELSFHGQIIAITPTSRGYVASIMCDRGQEGIYLTVAQANAYKVGDIINYTAVYDGWGEFKGLREIHKSQ